MHRYLLPILLLVLVACGPGKDGALPIPAPTPLNITLPWYFPTTTFDNPANPLTREGVDLGRHLFYDPRLSADGQVSCASCHPPEHAFSDPAPRSRGVGGQTGRRHGMALVNLLWTNHLFWDGRAATLETQAFHPIEDPVEMGMPLDTLARRLQLTADYPARFRAAFGSDRITPNQIGRALAQFQRTLISANARYDRVQRGEATFTAQEQRGLELFTTHPEPSISLRGGNCGDCHLGATFGGSSRAFDGFFNNGLQTDFSAGGDRGREETTGDATDRGRFRAPSLRNVALTAPYMHDGSLPTLEAVLDHYNHPDLLSRPNVDVLIRQGTNDPLARPDPISGTTPPGRSLMLTTQEKEDIVAFLHTLTDTSFLTEPAFQNPFHHGP